MLPAVQRPLVLARDLGRGKIRTDRHFSEKVQQPRRILRQSMHPERDAVVGRADPARGPEALDRSADLSRAHSGGASVQKARKKLGGSRLALWVIAMPGADQKSKIDDRQLVADKPDDLQAVG